MAVFVTSPGFGNARKPPAKKRGERAIARIWLPTRIAAIAAIEAYSRRMGRLLPCHASERHGPGDLLNEHLHNRALLDRLHGPPGAARVAFEHRDAVLFHETRVRAAALLAQDVRVDVGLDSLFELLRRDLALDHDVGGGDLEPLSATKGGREGLLRAGEELVVTERRHEARRSPGSV